MEPTTSERNWANVESFDGCCPICGNWGVFRRSNQRTRETFACRDCRGSLRYQAQAHALVELYGQGSVYSLQELAKKEWFSNTSIYEPGISGPFRDIFRSHPKYTNSFYWDDVANGEMKDGISCQNLQNTTYQDECFDLIITSDIFEHIRKPFDAFMEMRRILKKGGRHVFSIPMSFAMKSKTIVRTDAAGDKDVHLLPEVYHGNGVGGRSLVYTEFGRDIFDYLEKIQFSTFAVSYIPVQPRTPLLTYVSTRF